MDWLKCNICFSIYNDSILRPRSLSCGHTFCERCLNSTIKSETLTCPQCRKIHEMNSALDLPINFTLEGLLKSLTHSLQNENEGARSNEGKSDADEKIENLGRLKSSLEQERRLDRLQTSAGICYEHPGKECLFRCSSHKCWVCEWCIDNEKGEHPHEKCRIMAFDEEIEDRRVEQKRSLDDGEISCEVTLSVIDDKLSDLCDARGRHIHLVYTLQLLVAQHRKEEKNLQNQIASLEKNIVKGKDVKQRLLEVESTVSSAATLDESNAARDMVDNKNTEARNW
ncbi:unnamed protein product, partial [Meganyctiphanes norvegica]